MTKQHKTHLYEAHTIKVRYFYYDQCVDKPHSDFQPHQNEGAILA